MCQCLVCGKNFPCDEGDGTHWDRRAECCEKPTIIEGEIHSIEWRDDKPFSVTIYESADSTWSRTYDVDYCLRDKELYYSWSGGGHAKVNEGRSGLDVMPDIKTFDELVKHFDMYEGETLWCSQCNDRLPTENLCKHIYWDDDEGWWVEQNGSTITVVE